MKQQIIRWTAWTAVVVSGVFAATQVQRNFMTPAAAQTPAEATGVPTLADPPASAYAATGEPTPAGYDAAPPGSPFAPSSGHDAPAALPGSGTSIQPARTAYTAPTQADYTPPAAVEEAAETPVAPSTTFQPRPSYLAADETTQPTRAPAASTWNLGEQTPAASAYSAPPANSAYAAPPAAETPAGATNPRGAPAPIASPFADAEPIETAPAAAASPAPMNTTPPLTAAPVAPASDPFGASAEPAALPMNAGEAASPLSGYTAPEETPVDAFGGPMIAPANSGSGAMPAADGLNRATLPARGQGEPGPRELEGPQQPHLTVEKLIPGEVQVGSPTLIEIVVRNVGQVPAHRVEVIDSVPRNSELIDAAPHAEADAQGNLVWGLGTLQPQDEGIIRMRVRPLAEGPIGGTAIVSFAVEATCKAIATRPVLQVTQTSPKQVMIDDDVMIKIRITNAGTGVAKNVVLREKMPAGLRHPSGDELEYPVGDLKPGETATLDLALRAVAAGTSINELMAYGDGELESEPSRCEIAVTSPELDLQLDGPSRRFLERPATYTVALANPGTASAEEVGLVVKIPTGFDFVKADGQGRWNESTRTVSWLLAELPAGRTTSTTFTVMPTQIGSPALVAEATAERGLSVRKERQTTVEGVAALSFHVVDTADPIQVGEETTYEIHVVNQGSKISKNVRVAVDVPQSMKLVAAEGETKHKDSGGRIIFDPLESLAPKTEAVYRLRVQGLAAGDLRFRAQVLSDEMEKPVTKEESTQVFADP